MISNAIRAREKDFLKLLGLENTFIDGLYKRHKIGTSEEKFTRSSKFQVRDGVQPQVQVGDTCGLRAMQKLRQNNEGWRQHAAVSIMNEASIQVDLFVSQQDVLRPSKVFDLGELAALFHGMSQPLPLFRPEKVAPAESGPALHAELACAAHSAHLSRALRKLHTIYQMDLASEAKRRKMGARLSRGLCRAYRRSSEMSCVRAASMEHSALQLSFPIWLWLW